MERKANRDGITLTALVITIIILIILAGISINLALGDNGIIEKAQEAKKKQIIEEVKEQIVLEILLAQGEALEKNNELTKQQIENIIAKYGQLQEDGDTIILNNGNYKISLSELYAGATNLEGNSTEIVYHVSLGIVSRTNASKNGVVVMPNEQIYNFADGRAIATVLSNKVVLSNNNKLTLPKGTYTFESYVPIKEAKHGVGYKVFNSDGNLIVDHTYAGTTDELASDRFTLEETTDITVYWYRSNVGWTDLTYYVIKTN